MCVVHSLQLPDTHAYSLCKPQKRNRSVIMAHRPLTKNISRLSYAGDDLNFSNCQYAEELLPNNVETDFYNGCKTATPT